MSLARTVSNETIIDFLALAALRAMQEMIELRTLKKSFFGSVWPDPIGFLSVLHLKVYLIGSRSLTPLSSCVRVNDEEKDNGIQTHLLETKIAPITKENKNVLRANLYS